MKKTFLLLLLLATVCFLSMRFTADKTDLSPAMKSIARLYASRVNSFDSFLQVYPAYFYDSSYAVRQRKAEELAYHFKRVANFFIYFEPAMYYEKMAAPFQFVQSNRPGIWGVIPDHFVLSGPVGNEPDSVLRKRKAADSAGAILFIKEASSHYRAAVKESNITKHLAKLDGPGLFDALRTEIFRISTIDIANADFIIESVGMPSLNGAMESWLLFTGEVIKRLPSRREIKQRWSYLSERSRSYLAGHQDFKNFDRMFFIRNHLIPLSQFLNELQADLKIPFARKFSAIRPDAMHVYDTNVFNIDYFAPGKQASYTEEKAKLGELLFFDPILSSNNKRSCASCHKPSMAFTDSRIKSISFERNELPRNSPTVINSVFQKRQFWDMRSGSLEDQLDSVINNPHELNSSFEEVIGKINASPLYVRLFHKAFPQTKTNGIQREDVKSAIAVYERTLTGLNSRFDQYMRGDVTKLSQEEINGFNIYMGKARCGVCHYAPLFGPGLPPFYDITDHHSVGVPEKDSVSKYSIDPDKGAFKASGNPFTKFSFKTPTMRNIALTAPYMHNGIFKNLERVIDFYNDGAGGKFTKDMRPGMEGLPFLTIIPFPLQLNDTEKKELVAFLGSLTDTSRITRTPKRLPELTGKYRELNNRVAGGEY